MIPRRVVRDLERQLAREPGNQTVRVTLAAAYRELGRTADAVEQYRIAATAYLHDGRVDEAQAACASARALAPDDAGIQALQAQAQRAGRAGAGPRRPASELAAAPGRKAMRPVERAGDRPERSPSASSNDLETPLPPPMPLHDTGDSLVGLPVGLTTHEVTAELPPLPPRPRGAAPAPLPPAPDPRAPAARADARPLVRSADRPTRPLTPASRAVDRALVRLAELEGLDDAAIETAQGARVGAGDIELVTADIEVDLGPDGDGDDGGLDVDDSGELDVSLPVVALTQVRKAGERPSSPDLTAELATRRRPRMSAHELGLLDLEILVATPAAPADPDAEPGAYGGSETVDERGDVGSAAAPGAALAPGAPAAVGSAIAPPIDAVVPTEPAVIALPDTAIETAALPAAGGEPPLELSAASGAVELPPPQPGDFDDEPTQPPAADAATPEALHALLAAGGGAPAAGPGDDVLDREIERHVDGDGGTFAGGFGGTLAELAPDGSAVDGPLGVFSMLPAEAASDLARRAIVKLYDAGEVVVREGDAGDACYVIARGEVVVTRQGPAGEPAVELARLGEGALFGEFAILADRRRHATVTALGDAEIYVVPRLLLRELAAVYPEVGPALERFYRERLLANLIHSSPLFARLAVDQRAGLLAAFEPMRVESGQALVRQGERAGGLFLIVLGAVEVVCRTDDRRAVVLATLGEGAYVGEISLLTGDLATASVVACGPVELAALPAPAFYRLVSEYPELWVAMRDEADARRLHTARVLAGRTGVV